MTRRNFIALVSLCVLVALGVIAVGVGLFATRSESGQAGVRRWLQSQIASNIRGKVHIGRIGGTFLTGLTIDSLELRDDEDSLFVSTGRITLQYDPRDLVDRRLYFRSVSVEHPNVVLRQHENWTWNYKRLFRIVPHRRQVTPERGFGDFVVLDSVHLRNANLRLTIPWHVDDSLHGVQRDSAIRANIARKDHEIRRTREGFTQNYRWTNSYAFAPHVRVAHPDSAGIFALVDTLHTDESMPPFKWRNVKSVVRVLGDSAWMSASHWDLPASTGRAEGKIVWGSDLPVRYSVRVVGDSVSLNDIAWVYPTLPRTGSGKMVLDIRNERNLHLLDYAIQEMDVRTTKSRLRGSMTFETGGKVLGVHDVKMQADPIDFDLLRALNGKPFPADWQGTLTGTVTARGGPLTNFIVDAADITFRDAHVPGAVSHLQGRGELDILFPAFTAFHKFFASTDHFDLRTLTAIYPAFPRVTGILSGSAVLDSSWLDVRVSNADLTHTDGPAEPTHATGGGRITYGAQFMGYDLALQASPLSLTTLARSYPKLPLRGTFNGPMLVKGVAPDLDVHADLTGAAGHITYAGKVDADSLGGYGAHGAGAFDTFDAAALMGLATPTMRLAGQFDVDLAGDSLSNLAGSLGVRLDRSVADGMRLSGGAARVRFDHGIALVDTLRVDGEPGVLRARGIIGLTRSAGADSLALAFDADSLGGLRRYLKRVQSPDIKALADDSLAGKLSFRGIARGWLDSLELSGSLNARDIYVRGDQAHTVRGTLAMRSLRGKLTGELALRADTALAAGLHVEHANLDATITDAGRARFSVGANGENGSRMRATGEWSAVKDTTTVRVDTLELAVGASNWTLRRSSIFTHSSMGVGLDTLLFEDGAGGRLTGFVQAPGNAPVRIRIHADSVPLADVGVLAQLPNVLAGRLSMDVQVAGTRAQPSMTFTAAARGLQYAGLTTEIVAIDGGYADNRATLQANVLRGGRSMLDATVSYPVALTLFSARTTGDSIRGRVHADSVELALIEALSPRIRNSTGRLALDLAISGQPDHPHVGGRATVRNGGIEMPDVGLRFAELNGDISVDPTRDSLTVSGMRWVSPASGGTGALQGSIVFRDIKKPHLDLRLDTRGLRTVDKRGLARLDVSTGSTGLTLSGTPDAATLSGAVTVDRGTIYIPELVRKQLVDITPEDFALLFDTTDVKNRSIMPQPPAVLVEHLRLDGVSVRIGDEVWLRSREANIKLGGTLNVTRARDDRETTRSTLARNPGADSARYKLALSGTLSADRGTYTLDLTAVQREFQVQTGRITFFGTPDFNPEIDVTALYQVKQANRSDIDVRARIHGNFYPQPALELSSTDAYLSPSDLVSYLVTGHPSSELSQASRNAIEFVLPTAGAYVSRVLRDQLGGIVDQVQIQSGAVNSELDPTGSAASNQFRSFLYSTRLGGEKQISDKLFLSFSTGLCQLSSDARNDPSQQGLNGFVNAIEGKLEYRFPVAAPERLSLRAGREPAASALRCNASSVRGFVATPQQWGLSLFRSWSF